MLPPPNDPNFQIPTPTPEEYLKKRPPGDNDEDELLATGQFDESEE